jgi:hypothetical protein
MPCAAGLLLLDQYGSRRHGRTTRSMLSLGTDTGWQTLEVRLPSRLSQALIFFSKTMARAPF